MAIASSRFSVAIHCLLLIADKGGKPTSSDFIASSVGTNPVLIRRLMGELRAVGLVQSKAGPAGGFVLGMPVTEIALDKVYAAVSPENLFPRHENPNIKCPMGRAIGPLLDQVYGVAEGAVRDALRQTRLADLVTTAHDIAAA
jgi:Rrf2 family protein